MKFAQVLISSKKGRKIWLTLKSIKSLTFLFKTGKWILNFVSDAKILSAICLIFFTIFYRSQVQPTSEKTFFLHAFCLCWCHFLYCFIIYLSVRIEWHPLAHFFCNPSSIIHYSFFHVDHYKCALWIRAIESVLLNAGINFIRAIFLRMAPQMSNTIFQ